MKITEKTILKIIREEYFNRLLQLEVAAKIAEAELVDKKGNLLISKDLKVKHKDSGYEYTVDHIDGEEDNMVVHLRKPEVPRVEVPHVAKRMNETDGSDSEQTNVKIPEENQDPEAENIFSVPAEEFKKEYIVD